MTTGKLLALMQEIARNPGIVARPQGTHWHLSVCAFTLDSLPGDAYVPISASEAIRRHLYPCPGCILTNLMTPRQGDYAPMSISKDTLPDCPTCRYLYGLADEQFRLAEIEARHGRPDHAYQERGARLNRLLLDHQRQFHLR